MQTQDSSYFKNLDWPNLQARLESFCFTEEASDWARHLLPRLNRPAIEKSWQETDEMKGLIQAGYLPPLEAMANLRPIFKTAKVGSILNGEQLNDISRLLTLTQSLSNFLSGRKTQCPGLARHQEHLYALPKLQAELRKTVDAEGHILDTASSELFQLRQGLKKLKQKIEKKLTELMTYGNIVPYLQDNFFTTRHERYVIPLKLDGRGRVRGKIIDTSGSGQSLFFEPIEISQDNDQLNEFELLEKLEVIRILKELTAQITAELPIIETNYEIIVHLDSVAAKALLAKEQDAVPIQLKDQPRLNLLRARHPLLNVPKDERVANDIQAKDEQRILVITGPNAGGKTIVLKTVGLMHAMAKAGLLLPCDMDSELYLFENIYMEIGDSQDISANLSTFSSHIMALKPILNDAGAHDLVLLDELAVGTEPQTGEAVAQAVLEDLAEKKVFTVATTHFDRLKTLAMERPDFRNGAMEFSVHNYKPTYKLLWDVPGNSYGLEMADAFGLPKRIIERAKAIRGQQAQDFDQAIATISREKSALEKERRELEQTKKQAEQEKFHWENERRLLSEAKREASQKMSQKFKERIEVLEDELRGRFQNLDQDLKTLKKASFTPDDQFNKQISQHRREAMSSLDSIHAEIAQLNRLDQNPNQLPGEPASSDNLKQGSKVYVLPLNQKGEVIEYEKPLEVAEIQIGALKLRLSLRDLRVLDPQTPMPSSKSSGKDASSASRSGLKSPEAIPFVLPTSENTLDLRGQNVDEATDKMWRFIDKALLKGLEAVIIIHGHGNGDLKRALRFELDSHQKTGQHSYNLIYRIGSQGEGGDGVTVVAVP